jgi:hypothetical protein
LLCSRTGDLGRFPWPTSDAAGTVRSLVEANKQALHRRRVGSDHVTPMRLITVRLTTHVTNAKCTEQCRGLGQLDLFRSPSVPCLAALCCEFRRMGPIRCRVDFDTPSRRHLKLAKVTVTLCKGCDRWQFLAVAVWTVCPTELRGYEQSVAGSYSESC